MDYFDDLRRMQRIWDDLYSVRRIHQDMDLATRRITEQFEGLRSALTQVEPSLAYRNALRFELPELAPGLAFRNALRDTVAHFSSIDKVVEDQIRQLVLPASELSAAVRDAMARYEDCDRAILREARDVRAAFDLALKTSTDSLGQELKRSSDLVRNFQAMASPMLGMLGNELLRNAASGGLNPAFVDGFGADLLDHIFRGETSHSEEEIIGFLQGCLLWLVEQAKRLPNVHLSFDAILSIFVTIVSIAYGEYSTNETERHLKKEIVETKEALLEKVQDTEERLIEELRACAHSDVSREEYVVTKNARLREGPGTNFQTLLVLPPNLLVEEIDRDGEWSQVELFDYIEGKLIKGWVSSELLAEEFADEECEP